LVFFFQFIFGIFIKFGESFSLGSLLNQSQTYQGNPCGVYPDLSSFTGSGVIQIFVACIKRSAPSQDHITFNESKNNQVKPKLKSTHKQVFVHKKIT